MSSLKGKKILLGVSGSIAAYKAAFLVRELVKEGCAVRVIMTSSASDFVSPLTFSTLSKNPVASNVHDEQQWTNHVEWGLWADAMVIAPATAAQRSTIGDVTEDIQFGAAQAGRGFFHTGAGGLTTSVVRMR